MIKRPSKWKRRLPIQAVRYIEQNYMIWRQVKTKVERKEIRKEIWRLSKITVNIMCLFRASSLLGAVLRCDEDIKSGEKRLLMTNQGHWAMKSNPTSQRTSCHLHKAHRHTHVHSDISIHTDINKQHIYT